MRKVLTIFVAALMLTTLFAGMAGGAGSASAASIGAAPGAIKNPNDFIAVSSGEPQMLDPAVDYETAGGEVLQNVYETLVWYNGSSASELVPLLATEVPSVSNGGISADGLNYTFHLRANVKFHDNNTMTSEDVRYSFWRTLMINDPNGPAWIIGELLIPDYYTLDTTNATQAALMNARANAAITCPDNLTVVFHLVSPAPYFLYAIAFTEGSVVSKAFVEAHGGVVAGTQNNYMNTHCCGTGPYKFYIWSLTTQIILEKNNNYWRTPANFDHVYLKYITDYGTRLSMFQSGDADWIYVPRSNINDVMTNPAYRIAMSYPTFNIDMLGLNQNIRFPTGAPDTIPATFFQDKNARLAFASAYNYATYNHDVMLDTAITPNGVIPMGMFGYDATVPTYEYNLTKAAAYLKAVPNPNQPGKSWADTGFTISFNYNAGNPSRETSCFLLKAGLEALTTQHLIDGTISVVVQGLDWPTYLTAVQGKQLGCFFLGWAPDYADPQDYVAPFLYSSGTYASRCSINDPTLDSMITAAAAELDPAVRAQMYKQMSFYAYDQAYYVWTSQATNFHAEQRWVTGYIYNAMYSNLYYYPMGKVDYTTTAPDPVRNATASRILDTGNIQLNWVNPVNNGGTDITSYEIYRGTTSGLSGKALYDSVANTSRSYLDTGVAPNQPYYYFITAKNAAGESIYSAELNSIFSVPGAPTVTAIAENKNVSVAWSASADNGGYTITGYELWKSLSEDFSSPVLLNASTGAGTYLDQDVMIGPHYYYKVFAINALGNSNSVAVMANFTGPMAVGSLSTTAANSVISLNWHAPSYDGGYPVQWYIVLRSTSSSFTNPTQIANVTTLSYDNTGVTLNTRYYYKVVAYNEVGMGTPSAIVNGIITVPGVPTSLVATKGDGNVTLSWGAPAYDGGANIVKYTIYKTTSSTGIPVAIGNVTVAAGTPLKFVDVGNFSKGTTYYYTVTATNAAGEGTAAATSAAYAADADNTMLIIVGVIAALIIIVAIVWFVMKGKKGPKAPEKK